MARISAALALCGILVSWTAIRALVSHEAAGVQSDASIVEIERTLRAIDRTSGSDGKRAAAAYLDRKPG